MDCHYIFSDIRGSQRSNLTDFFFCCHYQIAISPNFGNDHHLSHLVELLLEKDLKISESNGMIYR